MHLFYKTNHNQRLHKKRCNAVYKAKNSYKKFTSSASNLGGTGGGVTVILFFAIGGGALGSGGGGVSGKGMKPNGRCPPKPAVCGSGVSPGVSGLSSNTVSSCN